MNGALPRPFTLRQAHVKIRENQAHDPSSIGPPISLPKNRYSRHGLKTLADKVRKWRGKAAFSVIFSLESTKDGARIAYTAPLPLPLDSARAIPFHPQEIQS